MIRAKALAREARRSAGGEAYRLVVRTPALRIGVGARGGPRPEFFVEVIVDPFPRRPRVDPDAVERALAGIRRLAARGYALTCSEDGSVLGERRAGARSLGGEVEAVRALVGGEVTGGP